MQNCLHSILKSSAVPILGDSTFAGLDFGTSNSCLTISEGQQVKFTEFCGSKTIPTAVFARIDDKSGHLYYGQEAIHHAYGILVEADGQQVQVSRTGGRLFRNLKSLLGSSTISEQIRLQDETGYNHCYFFSALIRDFIRYLKSSAELQQQREIRSVVMGRPVRFVDGDDQRDSLAQSQLTQIVHDAGIENVEFLYEPLAAALSYEQNIGREELALVVDVGGGTTDISVVRLHPLNSARRTDRKNDILSNGGVHIGGTDFDTAIGLRKVTGYYGMNTKNDRGDFIDPDYYRNLVSWLTMNRLYTPRAERIVGAMQTSLKAEGRDGDALKLSRFSHIIEMQEAHILLDAVEQAKIRLGTTAPAEIDLSKLLAVDDTLDIWLSRTELASEILAAPFEKIFQSLQFALHAASVKPEQIHTIFLTGGPTAMPDLQEIIVKSCPNAKVVAGDRFGAVGHGLALAAERMFS